MSGVKHSYIDEVLSQVRFQFDHSDIRQELEEHIEDGEFELLSDLDSRIDQLSRLGKMLGVIAMANLLIGLVNLMNPVISLGWINLLCATLLMYGLGRVNGKKEELEQRPKTCSIGRDGDRKPIPIAE